LRRIMMPEMWTSEWQQLCFLAASEVEPERRTAIIAELRRILGNDIHKCGPVSTSEKHKSGETASLFISHTLSGSFLVISLKGPGGLFLVRSYCAQSGAMTAEH